MIDSEILNTSSILCFRAVLFIKRYLTVVYEKIKAFLKQTSIDSIIVIVM